MSESEEQWPKTLDEAVDQLLSSLSDEDKEEFRNTPKPELIMFHHGLGTAIRNMFGLWRGNQDLLKSCNPQVTDPYLAQILRMHPDDASMMVIRAAWDKLQQW